MKSLSEKLIQSWEKIHASKGARLAEVLEPLVQLECRLAPPVEGLEERVREAVFWKKISGIRFPLPAERISRAPGAHMDRVIKLYERKRSESTKTRNEEEFVEAIFLEAVRESSEALRDAGGFPSPIAYLYGGYRHYDGSGHHQPHEHTAHQPPAQIRRRYKTRLWPLQKTWLASLAPCGPKGDGLYYDLKWALREGVYLPCWCIARGMDDLAEQYRLMHGLWRAGNFPIGFDGDQVVVLAAES